MVILDEYNRRIKQGDSYFIVTVFDNYHMPVKDYTDRIFKNKSDLNYFIKLVNEVAPGYYITSRKAVYSGSGFGV